MLLFASRGTRDGQWPRVGNRLVPPSVRVVGHDHHLCCPHHSHSQLSCPLSLSLCLSKELRPVKLSPGQPLASTPRRLPSRTSTATRPSIFPPRPVTTSHRIICRDFVTSSRSGPANGTAHPASTLSCPVPSLPLSPSRRRRRHRRTHPPNSVLCFLPYGHV